MILRVRWLVGKVLNLCGFASPIRECDYTASICRARITVQQRELFTVIRVNGLDIYFHRLTGNIDGVGLNPSADYIQTATARLKHFGVPPFDEKAIARTEIQSD